MVGHDSLLLVRCQFLLCLLGIHDFIPGFVAGIEPVHQDTRSTRFRHCQREQGIFRRLLTVSYDRLKGCVQNSPIRVEDLNNISIGVTVDQFE